MVDDEGDETAFVVEPLEEPSEKTIRFTRNPSGTIKSAKINEAG